MPRKTRRKRKTKKRFRKKNKKKTLSRKKLNYYKKKFRKFTKKYRKKMKGGGNFTYGCKNPQNMGELITGYANNTNPFLPDPKSLNSNLRVHQQKGGGLMYDFGLGDLLLNYQKATNFGKNIWHRYKGNKSEMPANTTHQPELRKNVQYKHTTANVPNFYTLSTERAAKNTIV